MSCLEIGTIHIDHVDVLNITADCSEDEKEVESQDESSVLEETSAKVSEDKEKSK